MSRRSRERALEILLWTGVGALVVMTVASIVVVGAVIGLVSR